MLLNKLKAFLSFMGFGGRSVVHAEDLQAEPHTSDDHNRIYLLGCNLIKPYMKLHGVEAPVISEQAREDVKRGISLLQEVVKLNPTNWAAFWIIGKGFQALNESEDARDAFGRSFAIQKSNPDVAREFMFECRKPLQHVARP